MHMSRLRSFYLVYRDENLKTENTIGVYHRHNGIWYDRKYRCIVSLDAELRRIFKKYGTLYLTQKNTNAIRSISNKSGVQICTPGKDNNMERVMENTFKRLTKGIKMFLDSMKMNPIDNVIAELNTKSTFVKVKGNSFHINKTQFSFVEFDAQTKKLQKSIDCYMGLEESLIFCQDVLSGKLPKKAAAEKAKGEQYPKPVWSSPLGGVNEQKARERKLRTDGKI